MLEPSSHSPGMPRAADALLIPTHAPIVYNDDDPFDDDEPLPPYTTGEILCFGIAVHLGRRKELRTLAHVDLPGCG